MHILATFDYSSAARLGFSTHYQPARGAPGRIRSTIMLEGYLLKYASSSKRISSGAKSRMLVFTTSKGLKYGPLNASRVKKLAWGDIARCQQVANNDVCFVVVTNREKEIKFECDNQVQRDAWCKYINENKTGALAVPTVKNNIHDEPLEQKLHKESLATSDDSGMFSDEESIEPFQRYVGKQSHFSNSRQYLASILPIVLTISVVATSLVVEARYYHQSASLLQLGY